MRLHRKLNAPISAPSFPIHNSKPSYGLIVVISEL